MTTINQNPQIDPSYFVLFLILGSILLGILDLTSDKWWLIFPEIAMLCGGIYIMKHKM